MSNLTNTLQKIRYNLKRHVYGITAPLRVLPDFIVVGFGKAGTTTLYHYLSEHPCIMKSSHDHLGFFDSNFELGLNFYKSFFPTKFSKFFLKYTKKCFRTYDVTASYIREPLSAKRILKTLPKIKLIIICRNPVDVAYSYYFNDPSLKGGLSFEEAIKNEIKMVENEIKNSKNYPRNLLEKSFLARAIYYEQIEIWYELFPKNQLLVIEAEDLAKDHIKTFNKIFDFLDLPRYDIKNFEKQNVSKYPPIKEETRKFLIDYFKPYNEKLYKLINENYDWEN
jgi:hypothetical protein